MTNAACEKCMALLKTMLFTILVPCAVTIYIPYWLLSARPPSPLMPASAVQYFGLLLIMPGAFVYLRCAFDFAFAGHGTPAPIDPPRKLVVQGLYSCVRNPMYVGVLAVLVGEAMFFASLALLQMAGIMFLLFHLFILFYEEPALNRQFGESYRRYCAAVPRWLPRFHH